MNILLRVKYVPTSYFNIYVKSDACHSVTTRHKRVKIWLLQLQGQPPGRDITYTPFVL